MFKKGLANDSPWRSCQIREWLVALIWLGYIPGVLALGYPLSKLTESETPYIVVGLGWMLEFALAGLALSFFKCRRCQKRFFHKWWWQNPFSRKCVHCGLPKWAEGQYC